MTLKRPLAKALLLGLTALLLLMALVWVIGRAGPLAPVQVTVVPAIEGSLTPALFGLGTVEARRSYLIGPTAAGRVMRVLVDVGDTVKAGQLLAEMDPVDLDSRVLALDSSMARARSAISAAEAQTVDATARRELAALTAQRYVALGQQNFMSAGAVEAKVQEQTSAQAGAQAAQANLAAARQDATRLQAERAGLAQQRQNARLVATQAGVVVSRDAEPGSTVVAGQAVLKLVDPTSLWVRARFDQGRSAGLAAGLDARIVLRTNTARALPGQVARVELQGDSVTEERMAMLVFDTLPPGLAMGELVEVTLELAATAPSVLVPNAAIRRLAGQIGVWVLDEDHPRYVPVRLGQSSLDGQIQVLEGLKAGAQVLTYSSQDITASSRLQVVKSLVPGGS